MSMCNDCACVHYDNGKCKLFSRNDVESWCIDGPCKDATPSNADRIRAMSDEELANFIMYGFSTDFYGTLMHDKIMFFSTDSLMEWLKQPAEEDLRCRV